MSYPTVFGNLAAGNQPASLFDTMFNIGGQQGNIPTTATGTNAISLVSKTNYYVGTSYTDGQLVTWQAVATSTGSVTMQWSGLGFLKYFTAAGVQAASGDIVINTNYISQYRANLDSGNGGFITLNASVTAIAQPLQGAFKNLSISVTSNTQVTPTADALVLQNAGGGTVRVTTFAPGACSTATTGANALDTGTVATSTWYFLYAIYNANTVTGASLLSLSSTSPALPSGYTYFARIGAVQTDGSANLYRTLQKGPLAQYVIGTNPTVALNIANATAGTYSATSPALVAVSLAGFTPSTARAVTIAGTDNWKGNGPHAVLVAPTTSWGGTNNGPQGSNGGIWPLHLSGISSFPNVQARILLETTSVAWASSGTGSAISVLGWEDNL